jgi:hypothetical protein
MSSYQRYTADSMSEVFRKADEILPARAGVARTADTRHSVTYKGAEGTVTVETHRHGAQMDVVVRTDQLRTSKLDVAAKHFLNQLPYQPGDPERATVTGMP